MAEPKYKLYSHGKYELYHNAGNGVLGQRPGNFFLLNASGQMPSQGSGDDQRNGDRINLSGFSIRMLFGQKADRPNVTFKVYVFTARSGITADLATMFENTTGNALLDTPNTDAVTVLMSKTYKPCQAPMFAYNSAAKEYTFSRKLWIPRKQEYKFTANGGTNHGDKNVWLYVCAYDAYGTIETDNIGYVQIWQKTAYRDP